MEDLQDKHVLLDNNVLIKIFKKPDRTASLIDLLGNMNCRPFIIDAVKFEFLRPANSSSEKAEMESFLNDGFPVVCSAQADIDRATELSMFSKHKDKDFNQKASYVDCLLAAHAAKFEKTCILATTNIKDFSTELFDRMYFHVLDLGREVITIAFLAFNDDKYRQVSSDFGKSKVHPI